MASRHLSIRINPESLARLERESRRQRRSVSDVARTLIEEGLRMEAHAGIVFRDGPAGRRPGLKNGADVWEVISCFPGGEATEAGIDHVMEMMALNESQVRDALRYYIDYRDDIDDWIRRNEEEADSAYAQWLAAQSQAPPV